MVCISHFTQLLALPFIIKIATERRRRFYDYDCVQQGAAPVAAAMPTSGHTAVYNRPTAMTNGATVVAPATPVLATPVYGVYGASNTGAVVHPAH